MKKHNFTPRKNVWKPDRNRIRFCQDILHGIVQLSHSFLKSKSSGYVRLDKCDGIKIALMKHRFILTGGATKPNCMEANMTDGSTIPVIGMLVLVNP